MPEKLRKMIGVVVLVCSISGVSCVGMVDTVMGDRMSSRLSGSGETEKLN